MWVDWSDAVKIELKRRSRESRIAYWIDYIIWKNGEESFFSLLKNLPVSRFNRDLRDAVNFKDKEDADDK